MAASNPPKGSVSSSSIKPVTRKAVRCQREVAWLVTQAAGRLVASTEDVNAPTPSFVLAAALDRVRQLEFAAQEDGSHLDYQNAMAPDLQTFCTWPSCPPRPMRFRTQATCLRFRARTLSATSTHTAASSPSAASLARQKSNRDMSSSWFLGCS